MLTVQNPDSHDWANMDIKELLIGNTLDSFVTYGLLEKLELPRQTEQVSLLLSKCLPIFNSMEEQGLDVDRKVLDKIHEAIQKQILINEQALVDIEIVKEFSDDFNVASNKQLDEFFTKHAGIAGDIRKVADISRSPKTEKYSYNEFNLTKLKSKCKEMVSLGIGSLLTDTEMDTLTQIHDLLSLVLSNRELKKLFSAYIDTAKTIVETLGTDKLYCNYKFTGTVTGRLSCEAMQFGKEKLGVSMHTVPRNEEYNMRDVIVPSPKELEDGYLFFTIDYSAMELRVLAQACKDLELIHAFKSGTDLHTVTASKIFRKNFDEVSGEERQIGKMTNFLTVYGGGPKRLAEVLNMPYREAKNIIANYHKSFPGIDEFRNRVVTGLKECNETFSLFGRRRVCEEKYDDVEDRFDQFRLQRQAVNSIIQSSASDILLVALVGLDSFIKEKNIRGRMVATVHDSIEFVMHRIDFFEHFQELVEVFVNPSYRDAGITSMYEYQRDSEVKESPIEAWEIPLEIDISLGRSFGSHMDLNFSYNSDKGKYIIHNTEDVVNYVSTI